MSAVEGQCARDGWRDKRVELSPFATSYRESLERPLPGWPLAAVAACWALVLGRFSHTDDVVICVETAMPGVVHRSDVTLSYSETLGALAARLAQAPPVACDVLALQQAYSLLLFSGSAAFEPMAHCIQVGGLVCLFRLESGVPVELVVRYHAQRHDATWVSAVAHHFADLYAAFPQGQSCGEIELLDALQHERIVHEWNDTERHYKLEQCLHWLFEEQALRTPLAVAVEFEGTFLTYAELDRRSACIANRLLELGAVCGTLVPFYAERSLEMVVGILAILRCGGAYVPIDPSMPAAHTRLVLDDCRAEIILTLRRFIGRIEAGAASIAALEDLVGAIQAPRRAGDPRGVACVMYTSGSTGTPKGTLIPHRSLVNNILWLQDHWPLDTDDRLLQKTPHTFDVSIKEIFWPLASGARIVLARPRGHLDMGYLVALVAERGITVCHFVPSLLQRFLDVADPCFCRSFRIIMCGAEILPPSLKQRFFERLGAKLLHLYGPTEAAISVTGWECRPGAENGAVVPLGKPMANVQLYLLDRFGKAVPPGVPGDIHIGGVAVANGYLNRPELTSERFLPNHFARFAHAGPLYRTGDLARYREDGTIEFIGRIDQQVKIQGARVEIRHIEAVLHMHSQVKHAAVCARVDRRGATRLIAYVVVATEHALSIAILREHCAQYLPGFMIPTSIVFLDEMPLLPNCKVDYSLLP